MKTKFKITNIDCEACIKLSVSVLQDIPGVTLVEIGQDGSGFLESDKPITPEQIIKSLEEVDKKVTF